MSSERNPEVVGCDASIMKNVWEIRAREHESKIQLEEARLGKSALPSINLDWAGRLAAKAGGYKRTDTRPRKRAEIQAEDIWKSKEPRVPNVLSRPLGSGPLGRPGIQSRNFPTPTSKDKKAKDKTLQRLHLLMFISQGQPSSMVWGKSWKYNKGLPPQAEGSTLGWGQCWLFASQQPFSEAGKPWPNGPSKIDPKSLHICQKPDSKMVEPQQLHSDLPAEVWKMSWRKYDEQQMKRTSQSEENDPRFALNRSLVESQQRNEAFSTSEWSESWRATKPVQQQRGLPVDSLANDPNMTQQNKSRETTFKWEESWKFSNQQRCNNSMTQRLCPDWADSWRVSTVVLNNHADATPSLRHTTNHDNRDFLFHRYELMSCELRSIALYVQLGRDSQPPSEWKTSWQVTKNNSKPSEEIEKVLKAPPTLESTIHAKKVEKNHEKAATVDPGYGSLKDSILYWSKRKFSQSKLFLIKYLETSLPSPEWRDSWKMIKHQMRQERRRMRANGLEHFRSSDRPGDMKPAASEWKDSWRSFKHSPSQVPDMWHQEWLTTPQIRVNRARDEEHFVPVERPKNGPSGEPGWVQSWRFSRRQLRSHPQQSSEQTSHRMIGIPSRNPEIPNVDSLSQQAGHGNVRSASDWQPSWMVSETQFHHDNPAFSPWREAWSCSIYHSQLSLPLEPTEMMMEIQPMKEMLPVLNVHANMSQSLDQQMIRDRYPPKEWQPSWSAKPLLSHQQRDYGSSGVNGRAASNSRRGSGTDCRWGKSFRVANPMPHTEQAWDTSCSNSTQYPVMWAKGRRTQLNMVDNLRNDATTFRIWMDSCWFLQNSQSKHGKASDPREIIPRKTKTSRDLFCPILSERQSEKKWTGCHLLGKTQPPSKKNFSSEKKILCEDNDDTFFEEWVESWKILTSLSSLKKQKSFKLLSGWKDSWKSLIPQYQTVKNHRARGH